MARPIQSFGCEPNVWQPANTGSRKIPQLESPVSASTEGRAGRGPLEVDVQLVEDDCPVATDRIAMAVRQACLDAGADRGWVDVAVVADEQIHELNRRHLQHDYPTDVVSFSYRWSDGEVQGELIVSWTTAARIAAALGGDPQVELLWYAIHGALHLCGADDQTLEEWQTMRQRERAVLGRLGLPEPPGFDERRREWCRL
jgi:probable rRNA maturation factor